MDECKISKKLNHYRKQLAILYKNTKEKILEEIVNDARLRVEENVYFDNWDGGCSYHNLIVYINPKIYSKFANVEAIDNLAINLRDNFNKVSASITDEEIKDVFIEVYSPSDKDCINAIAPDDFHFLSDHGLKIWKPGYLKLFISHRDKHKKTVSELADYLLPFGISCFVAHTDIEPTDEWQNVIINALHSMDAFLAFITDDFYDGNWTNQEIGVAVAKGVPIIPVKFGHIDPRGFIMKTQALKCDIDDLSEAANSIHGLLVGKIDKKGIVKTSTISAFISSTNFRDTKSAFDRLNSIPSFTSGELDFIVKGFNENDQLYNCLLINRNNKFYNFLQTHGRNIYIQEDRYFKRKTNNEIEDVSF